MIFLQSDVDEFTTKYASKLDDSILTGNNGNGDISPSKSIYERYMERLSERVMPGAETLKAGI